MHIFKFIANCFPRCLLPTSQCYWQLTQISAFLHPGLHIVLLSFIIFAIMICVKWYFVTFPGIFLVTGEFEFSFTFIDHLGSLFCQCPFSILLPPLFFIGFFVLLLLTFRSSCVWDGNHLSIMCFPLYVIHLLNLLMILY